MSPTAAIPRTSGRLRPYPGTAAIASHMTGNFHGDPVREWTLCMPMMPLDVRVARWKGDLIGAYTVHELLHALWTDWNVVKATRAAGLHGLCNALEDCRIEARATKGDLVLVSEARRLLMALNAHIARRALNTPHFRLDDPAQFSFILGLRDIRREAWLCQRIAERLDYARAARMAAAVQAGARPVRRVVIDAGRASIGARPQGARRVAAEAQAQAQGPKLPPLPGGEGVESEREGGKPGSTPVNVREREITEPEPEDETTRPRTRPSTMTAQMLASPSFP